MVNIGNTTVSHISIATPKVPPNKMNLKNINDDDSTTDLKEFQQLNNSSKSRMTVNDDKLMDISTDQKPSAPLTSRDNK